MPDLGAIEWSTFLGSEEFWNIVRVVLLIGLGYLFLRIGTRLVIRFASKRLSDQAAMLFSKGVYFGGLALLIIIVLQQLGFEITALLGAAGVLGVAIGFASQTSVSNIISGLFLISERPFAVGDIITVGDTTGVVLAIDLLSVKVRAFDNRFIRIPNENIIKTEVVNLTRFPIRRVEINVGVAYKEDVGRVKALLKDITAKNPAVLDEPEPLILFSAFGDSALDFMVGAWCVKTDVLALRNSLMQDIKERFDAEGIEIPFPHMSLYTGEATKPFPLHLVSDDTQPTEGPTDSTAAD